MLLLLLSSLELFSAQDKRKSVTSINETIASKEFGIEMLLDNHDHGSKVMMFETLSIHDRKLWLQNMNDAVENYHKNVEEEKKKKYSGTYLNNYFNC